MRENKETIIFLTACVEPKGMLYTVLNDKNIRINQYYEAFDFYIEKTRFKILIVENTMFNIDDKYKNNKRIEYLTFDGNNYDKSLGKGYGEALIIEYALKHSKFLNTTNNPIIVKITGRLKILNINNLVNRTKYLNYNSFVSAVTTWKLNFVYSYFFIASKDFFQQIVNNKYLINDKDNKSYFEHLLAKIIKSRTVDFIGLNQSIIIKGISGSTGKNYQSNNSLKDVINLKLKNLYINYLLR